MHWANDEEKRAYFRKLGSQGGRTTFERYGAAHMSQIGRKGFRTVCRRYFLGSHGLMARWLTLTGLFNYWQSTGLPMKYDAKGAPLWPDEAPLHPAHTVPRGQLGLFECL